MHEVDPFSLKAFYVGFENYRELLSSSDYWQSVRVSCYFVLLTTIPSVVLSLAIAIGLNAQPFATSLFRTIFLAPVAISSAMAAMLWIFLYNPTAGYLNYVLEAVGIPGPNWLGSPRWALPGVALATVWREIGFNVIFFLAGLSSIPRDLLEAAAIDGASKWQRFRYVVLPILSPTVFFVAVVSVINSFQSFGQIHILTGGGPANASNVLVYKLYRDAFQNFRTGFASAQAVLLFALILVATVVQFSAARRRVHYG